ncbi:MAG: hypothetical protein GYB31_05065 [Bacteroidetes bacterium]|nr:hypothetical protein [Bacteroidota bacterium]
MLSPADWTLELEYDDHKISQILARPFRNEDLFIDAGWNRIQQAEGAQFQLTIHPKKSITLKACRLTCAYQYQKKQRIFINGYQSWSESGEMFAGSEIPRLRKLGRPYFKYFGDEWIKGIKRGKGQLHSWTYSYIREAGPAVCFIASLNERSCFSLIQHDTRAGRLCISLDIDQLKLSHSYPALEMLLFKGRLSEAADRWRNMYDLPGLPPENAFGWQSWQQYQRAISPDILIEEARSCKQANPDISYFLIGQGYQAQVGDWLQLNKAFDNQMNRLVREINFQQMDAGLWIAPYICSRKSAIYQKHKDWLLKDKKGKPLAVGNNRKWGGWYYALNVFHPGVREYLTGIFHVICRHWGFQLLKLDCLFAAALAPPTSKTRGQVMFEAVEFIRHLVGPEVKLLACGVPMAAAFGQCDFAQISPELHLKKEHKVASWLRNRERSSTRNALKNILARWMLNNRFFRVDPGIFLLSEKGNALSDHQRQMLFMLNLLLGDIHFTADNFAAYAESEKKQFQELKGYRHAAVSEVSRLDDNRYMVIFKYQGSFGRAIFNLSRETWEISSLELEP